MTHLSDLDTIGKIRKKETYEDQLGQLEKDIKLLSNQNIIVDLSC